MGRHGATDRLDCAGCRPNRGTRNVASADSGDLSYMAHKLLIKPERGACPWVVRLASGQGAWRPQRPVCPSLRVPGLPFDLRGNGQDARALDMIQRG